MAYRQLTDAEINQYVAERQKYNMWQTFITYGHEVYGSNAHEVRVEVESQYNDEGGSDDVIESIVVVDVNGNRLPLQLPSREFYDYHREHGYLYTPYEEIAKSVAEEGDDYEDDDWVYDLKYSMPIPSAGLAEEDRYGTFVFRADDPPHLSYQKLFVEE